MSFNNLKTAKTNDFESLVEALCRSRGYVVWHNVVRQYVAFGLMSFSIMSHSALCRIRPYVVRLCVVRRIVVRHNAGVSVILVFKIYQL